MPPSDPSLSAASRAGQNADRSTDDVIDPENPPAQALVILPFLTPQSAEQFAQLVTINFGAEFSTPIVTLGTAYEYMDKETGECGQVFELPPAARWEAFIKDGDESHHILRRITQEGTDEERTG